MRLSRYFLPILRDTPKDAEIVSHRLMLRAGMIRQEAAGIYAWFYRSGIAEATLLTFNAIAALIYLPISKLQHSHVALGYGPAWSRWLISPLMHQVHHSAETRHWDRNMGFTFSIWDRMAGTLYVPKADEQFRLGLPKGNEGLDSVWRLFVQPWQTLAWVVMIVGWLIPFAYLLKRLTGRPPQGHTSLVVVAVFGLVAIFLERILVIVPSVTPGAGLPLGWREVLITAGFLALFLLSRRWFFRTFRPELNLS